MKSPILFVIFNRPDTTRAVFEEIRKARPPRLYIAADGPRDNRPGEDALCRQTRDIVSDIDWDCEVKTLFSDKNLGCGIAVSKAISWFFENEPEGIILEDDILPHPDFFLYCDEMLEKYRSDDSVGMIGGHSIIYKDVDRQASYGFHSVPQIWGWATWRNRWKLFDYKLSGFSEKQLVHSLKNNYRYTTKQIIFWKIIHHKMTHSAQDHIWDYQWAIILLSLGKLNVAPYKSLTKNIGFTPDATHTFEARPEEANMVTHAILPLSHPNKVELDYETDQLETINGYRYRRNGAFIKYKLKTLFVRLGLIRQPQS